MVLGAPIEDIATWRAVADSAERFRAGRFFPREQLAVSTQCGFASAGPGNAISETDQAAKLRLASEIAERAWG